MSSVALWAHDDVVTDTEDPHGLKARLRLVGIHKNNDLVELGLGSPNAITRALSTTKPSATRGRIEAYLAQRESDTVIDPKTPGPGADILKIVGDARAHDVRITYGRDGRIKRLSAVLVEDGLTDAEVEAQMREWREGGHE
jgi:hypothetical protein